MKVAVGVPTFNRRHLVELHASALRASFLPHGTEIVVIDDASTEYDAAYLKSIFPDFSEIHRRPENSGGASFAQRYLMEHLLKTNADAVMLLDSDLIVGQNFLTLGTELLQETGGVLSLFNTPNHPSIDSRGPFLIKRSIGCAGSFWTRETALEMMDTVGPGMKFDWRFSDFLNDAGIEICVVKNSLVQHVGYSNGQNHNFESGDFGAGFGETDAHNAYRVIELLMSDSQLRSRHVQSQLNSLQNQTQILLGQNEMMRSQSEALRSQNEMLLSQNGMLERRLGRIETLLGITWLRSALRFVRGARKSP